MLKMEASLATPKTLAPGGSVDGKGIKTGRDEAKDFMSGSFGSSKSGDGKL